MELNKAIKYVSALAEGIDPTTGELLPEDSVYNKAEVVRALYAVLSQCQKTNKTPKEPENYDKDLYERLRLLRNKLAKEKNIINFKLMTNLSLMYLAANMPTSKEEFIKIPGIGKYTTRMYGDIFISEIKWYLENKKTR